MSTRSSKKRAPTQAAFSQKSTAIIEQAKENQVMAKIKNKTGKDRAARQAREIEEASHG